MKATCILQDHVLIERGVSILMKSLGPVETKRFLAMSTNKRTDSVKRHRKWQKEMNKEAFLKEAFS